MGRAARIHPHRVVRHFVQAKEENKMKTRPQFRAQAGFTLVELLVAIAILSILIDFGLVLPPAQRATKRLADLHLLTPLAGQINDFNAAVESNAQAFTLSLGDDALAANDSETATVHLDSLKFFCDADTKLADLQSQVNALLAAEGGSVDASSTSPSDDDGSGADGSSKKRRVLTDTKNALDAELPAVQKLGNLLRTKGGNVCSPVLQ
jgi:prepilin-type N-terminal cleavage/methylation domain-containing protein